MSGGASAILMAVCVVGVIAILAVVGIREALAQQRTLSTLADKLRGGFDITKGFAWGKVGGTKVRFRHVTRGTGKTAQPWTEIEAELPSRHPLRLFVRKQGWLDHGKIERGEVVDVQIGDPVFDAHFLVEAAPSDVARALLDARERSYLLALSRRLWIEVLTVRDGGTAMLRLDLRSWVTDLEDAMLGIEAVVAIAGRVGKAYARANVEQLDDEPTRASAETRLLEVAHLDQVRTKRMAAEQFGVVVLCLALVTLAAAAAWFIE